MTGRRPYPSDLSDARRALVEPTPTAWRQERTARALAFGRPPEHDLRDLLDAILYVDRTGIPLLDVILYVDRTGIPRRYLPHDYPPREIDVEIVRRDPATGGSVVQPRRRFLKRTFGRLMNHRRPARDYETLPARSEVMIHVAMTGLTTRRPTGESTPN